MSKIDEFIEFLKDYKVKHPELLEDDDDVELDLDGFVYDEPDKGFDVFIDYATHRIIYR